MSSKLNLQQLETREVPAGDINAYVSFGDLYLYGDSQDNDVWVSQLDHNTVRVYGWHSSRGYTTTINGKNWDDFDITGDDLRAYLGAGNDRLELWDVQLMGYSHSDLTVSLGNGNDYLYSRNVDVANRVYIRGEAGNDTLKLDIDRFSRLEARGDDGNDSIVGTAGNDTLLGGLGRDTLEGNAGHDSLDGADHGANGPFTSAERAGDFDLMDGGSGNDTLRGWYGNDTMYGGSGHDEIFGGSDNDFMYGEDGNDTLVGYSGNDTLDGGPDRDIIKAESGNDLLVGGSGDDLLSGGSGNDTINADAGHDGLWGGSGTDDLNDGSGDDRFYDLDGQDTANIRPDLHSNDVVIDLSNGLADSGWNAGAWTDAALIPIDDALLLLQQRTGNHQLLQGAAGETLDIFIYGTPKGSSGVRGWNSGAGRIAVTQNAYDQGDRQVMQSFIHEVGHNWDNYQTQNENDLIDDFLTLSGWVKRNSEPTSAGNWIKKTKYGETWWYNADLTSALFARAPGTGDGYSTVHPVEDWATAFSLSMLAFGGLEYNIGYGILVDAGSHLNGLRVSGSNNDKVELLDRFFDAHA